MICDWQAVEFLNNLKAERSGKKIDVEILEGELADDVCVVLLLDLGAAQSSIFGSARNFSARSAGSSRKLRVNSNHAPKVNAHPYWAYNRPMMRMYEHLYCHLRRGLIICCVCV